MLDQRDLVEHGALGARDGALVVGAAALLQPLERLPLAGGLAQRVAARADLGVMAVQVELARLAHLLHPLQVGLVRREVCGLAGPVAAAARCAANAPATSSPIARSRSAQLAWRCSAPASSCLARSSPRSRSARRRSRGKRNDVTAG